MKKKDKVSVKYDKLEKFKIKCDWCGHNQILKKKDKEICTWCKHYIYTSPLEKFKDKLNEAMIKSRREVKYE